MKTESTLKIYEINGSKIVVEPESNLLIVRNHWNERQMVVLEDLDGKKITVLAAELVAAIDAAQFANQY
jgi:hypothetical protein